MEDYKKDLIVSATLGHRLFEITLDNTDSVGHGLMAGVFNVCLLAKSSPVEITQESLILLLKNVYGMVSDASEEATNREAAKYGMQ